MSYDRAVGQSGAVAGPPLGHVLATHEVGDAPEGRESERRDQFGGAGVVNAPGVAECDTGRNVLREVVDAG